MTSKTEKRKPGRKPGRAAFALRTILAMLDLLSVEEAVSVARSIAAVYAKNGRRTE